MDREDWTRALFDLHDRNTDEWDDLTTIAERLTVLDFLAIYRKSQEDP